MVDIHYDYDLGMAYQKDRTKPIQYNIKYAKKLDDYRKNTLMHDNINTSRCNLVTEYVKRWQKVLDIGCGNGDFINALNKSHLLVYGYDIIPDTIKYLKSIKAYRDVNNDSLTEFDAFCMWDVLEHLEEPKRLLKEIPYGSFLFVSIPIFESLTQIKDSRHYRPNEHFWYFTHNGFINYMDEYFRLIEHNEIESDYGRENIRTYVFKKRSMK